MEIGVENLYVDTGAKRVTCKMCHCQVETVNFAA